MRIPLNVSNLNSTQMHRHTRAFRGLLQAFGYPARLHHMDGDAIQEVIDSLLDPGTTIALWNLERESQILATGAVVSEPAEWIFAPPDLADLSNVPTGTYEMPEGGATVILPVTKLSETEGPQHIRATGAGISTTQDLFVTGLSSGIIHDHIAFRADYPRGADLLLCAGSVVTALPRHLNLEMI